jgi:hypothetical protein
MDGDGMGWVGLGRGYRACFVQAGVNEKGLERWNDGDGEVLHAEGSERKVKDQRVNRTQETGMRKEE